MVTASAWPLFMTKRWVARSFVLGAVSMSSVLLGVVPGLNQPSAAVSFSAIAYAQDVSDQEVQEYAQSVLQIEPIRQATYDTIKAKIGYVPEIACHRPSSLNDLDASIRQDALDYCNQAIAIVERNNLTINRFNQITVEHQSNAELLDRIQKALQQLQ